MLENGPAQSNSYIFFYRAVKLLNNEKNNKNSAVA